MKRLLCACFCLLLAGGCATSGPQNFEDTMQLLDRVDQVAKENGVAYGATLRWNGRPSLGQKTDFYLDSGLSVEIHLQGNAAANREAVP